MNHTGTITLTTPRLVLRKYKMEDAQAMYDNWASDPMVTKYLSWDAHQNVEKTQSRIAEIISQYEKPDCYEWMIELEGVVIGTIGLFAFAGEENETTCEVGYCMSQAHWGKGIMAEALAKVIDHGVNTVGVGTIGANHDIDNPNSGRVMMKCGMTYLDRKTMPLTSRPDIICTSDLYEIKKER